MNLLHNRTTPSFEHLHKTRRSTSNRTSNKSHIHPEAFIPLCLCPFLLASFVPASASLLLFFLALLWRQLNTSLNVAAIQLTSDWPLILFRLRSFTKKPFKNVGTIRSLSSLPPLLSLRPPHKLLRDRAMAANLSTNKNKSIMLLITAFYLLNSIWFPQVCFDL